MQEQVKNRDAVKNESKKSRSGVGLRVWLIRCIREVVWVLGAWLLGQAELAFGTFPLGLALLCASEQHVLPVLLGLLGASVGQMKTPVLYIVTYLTVAAIRVAAGLLLEGGDSAAGLAARVRGKLFSSTAEPDTSRAENPFLQQKNAHGWLKELFCESLCLRMATAAVAALILSLYRVFAGGFRYYDFFAALFAVIVASAAVPVYAACLNTARKPAAVIAVSKGALLFSFVFASNSVSFLGLPLSPILAMLFTLCVTEREGNLYGALTGILCGVAYDPLSAPAYLLAACLYGVVKSTGRNALALPLSGLSALVWAVYVGGIAALWSLLPSYLLAGVAFTLLLRLKLLEAPAVVQDPTDENMRLRMEGTRHRDSSDRFRGISEAFSALSEMFYNLSDRFRRPGTLDLRCICDRAFDSYCTDCPNKTCCWGLEYSETLHTVNGLISALHTKGRVSAELIPDALSHRCGLMPEILETVNRECAKLTGEMLKNNRTEIFAMDYESAAEIINDALEEENGEYCFDCEQEQKIGEYLSDAGIRTRGVTVYGKRRRQIVVRDVCVEDAKISVETLRSDLGELCGSELSVPAFEVEGGVSNMILHAKKKFSVTGAQNNIAADGGISGDSVNLFSNKKDYFYALISDGMGAGKVAAMTSGLCSVFLEKMLRAGNRAGTSLRMLNNLVRSKDADSTRECSSTVDLLELDLMTGDAVFIKSGAAPSFVVRGGVVQTLRCGTAPIGIICAPDVQNTPYRLRDGDLVVMISDGILQKDPECKWLCKYLESGAGTSPEEIVYRICLHAAGEDHHDDCSAVALRIDLADE